MEEFMKFNIVLGALLSGVITNAAIGMGVVNNNLVHRKLVNVQVINCTDRDYLIAFSKKKDALEEAAKVCPSDITFSENVPASSAKNINLYFDFDKWAQGLKNLHVYVIYKPDTVCGKEIHWIKGLRFALHVTLASNNNCMLEGRYIHNAKVEAEDVGCTKERDIDLYFHSIISDKQQLTLDKYQLCLILDGDTLEKSTGTIEPYNEYKNMIQQGLLGCLKILNIIGVESLEKNDATSAMSDEESFIIQF
jgi:hypothetical protein